MKGTTDWRSVRAGGAVALLLTVVAVTVADPAAGTSATAGSAAVVAENPRPIPEGLWEPDPGSLPDAATFVYLESSPGDPIGQGGSHTYLTDRSTILPYRFSHGVIVDVSGNTEWHGFFGGPQGTQLAPGYHGDLASYDGTDDPARGAVRWWAPQRSCTDSFGWFVVDHVRFDADGQPEQLRLRFEHRCNAPDAPPLRGMVVYDGSATVERSSNPRPVRDDLWEPDPALLPKAATFVHLDSEPGDYIGQGGTFTYTTDTALVEVSEHAGSTSIRINGNEWWNGYFGRPDDLERLEPGLYDELTRGPPHDRLGGVDWGGEGRGCSDVQGWFVVDEVTYAPDDSIKTLRLRFEQHCGVSKAPLHGLIVYDASAPLAASPNPRPVPAGLWEPNPLLLPTASRFVHLESEPGDPIGGGQTFDYTGDQVSFMGGLAPLHVFVRESPSDIHHLWRGDFVGPEERRVHGVPLEPGFYGELRQYPSHNRRVGGIGWGRGASHCPGGTSWFVVDEISYTPDHLLRSLELRFEFRCEADLPALRGLIVLRPPSEPTASPNPRPIPEDLWEPSGLPDAGTFVHLESEVGDPLGEGRSRTYRTSSADISLRTSDEHVWVSVLGNQRWRGRFTGPRQLGPLREGLYEGLAVLPFYDPRHGGLSWADTRIPYSAGEPCGRGTGWFSVDDVAYTPDGALQRLRLRFEQRCENAPGVLRGVVAYDASAAAEPSPNPGSVPASLWQPQPDELPDATTFVHLESAAGDHLGQGRTATYRRANSDITVTPSTGAVTVRVDGNEWWNGRFDAPRGRARLQAGYYGDLAVHAARSLPLGGLEWQGDRRGCVTVAGWFAVDDIAYSLTGQLRRLRLRFEQRCEEDAPPLRGLIVYDALTPAEPGPNPAPIPAELWEPDPTTLPDAASFVHLESESGEVMGAGGTYDYRTAVAHLGFAATASRIDASVAGDERWHGTFAGPDGAAVGPGYYGDLRRHPRHRPRLGGLAWVGEHRRCDEVYGWFAIDELTRSPTGTLRTLRLRFEQRCGRWDAPALRGLLVYDASASPEPSPNPRLLPDGLWEADPRLVPAGHDTYVVLDSAAGDHVGRGTTRVQTLATDTIDVAVTAAGLSVTVDRGRRSWWDGEFVLPDDASGIEPGYYGGLHRSPLHNERMGGVNWMGYLRGCVDAWGWYVIDTVRFDGLGRLEHVRLRFEQRCDTPDAAPLHGLVVWTRGAVAPPPAPPDPDPVEPGDPSDPGDPSESGPDPDPGSDDASQAGEVRILGGPMAVSEGVADHIASLIGAAPVRLAGDDRYQTAAAIVADAFPDPVPLVYLATGAEFPDALAGAAAAARVGAPVLLTEPGRLPQATAEQLARLRPAGVKVLGGTAAVSDEVLAAVANVTGVAPVRIGGAHRYRTAAAIVADAFPEPAPVVYVATGEAFPDALAGAAAAAAVGAPVLLTARDHLPPDTADELARLRPSVVKVLGGTSAVSDTVVAQVAWWTGVQPQRIGGTDRYATAAATVADVFPGPLGSAYVATGLTFPDALAGAAAAAEVGAPVLLTEPHRLPDITAYTLWRLLR